MYSSRRNAVEWMMRSRSRWNWLRDACGVSSTWRPRPWSEWAADGAAFVLLVHFHQLQPARRAQVGRRHGQAGGRHQRAQALHGGRVDIAQALRQLGRHDHAAADRLAVQPVAVAHAGLDGVAEGVAEVEDGAQAAFALVLTHDVGLDLAGTGDRVGQRRAVARHQLADIFFDPVEEGAVDDGAVLDHLGQAGGQLALGQRVQGAGIGQYHVGLVERADHVLAQRVVDARLAADRGIDLRQQGGGHLDEVDAAHVRRGGEAGQVADDAAAEGDQGRLAVAFIGQQRVEDLHQAGPVLVFLAVLQHDGDDFLAGGQQRRAHSFQVQGRHRGVGDDGDLAAVDMTHQQVRLVQQALADRDRVAAFAQVDVEEDIGLFVHRELCPRHAIGRGLAGARVQLVDDDLNHRLYVRSARIDDEVRHLQVQRLALGQQLFQFLARVGRLQQRTVLVVAGAGQDAADARPQVDHGAPLLQQRTAVRIEDGAAAGGQHDAFLAAQVTDHFRFTPAKAGLALDLEDQGNRGARARLDLVIRVDEAHAHFPGQHATDCRLAGSHQPYQKYILHRVFASEACVTDVSL